TRRERVRAGGAVVVVLEGRADRGALEGPGGQRDRHALRFVVGRITFETLVVADTVHGEPDAILDDRKVERTFDALAAEAVDLEPGARALLTEARLAGEQIDRARGIAETEQVGVRTAADLDRVEVVRVDRHTAGHLEATHRDVRLAETADAVGAGGIDAGAIHHDVTRGTAVLDLEVGELVRALGVG